MDNLHSKECGELQGREKVGCKPNSKKQPKKQGRSTLLKFLGWGCISPLFREIKETGSKYRAQSWPGIWGSAD